MKISKSKILIISVLIISIFRFPVSNNAQVRPVYDYGAIGLGQLLKKLNNTKSVMMIGAHPDDEDSALLAFLARGENARTTYLSLTRGDGGQNLIGDELFEPLGVIRTEELLQARRLDGAEQYFTRAFDYGFSKTLTEAKEKWDEKIVLCDAVRAIRKFRPLVVISRFSGTPADGHGHHQFAGYISPIAVKTAADAMQCKDAGAAWQVQKFYVEQGFRSTDEPTLKINTGVYDYLLGRSFAEIAAEGRSQHKTQEQGGLELKGDRFSGLNLIESEFPKTAIEKSVFDGIDTSIAKYPQLVGAGEDNSIDKLFSELQTVSEKAAEFNNLASTTEILPVLARNVELISLIKSALLKSYTATSSPKSNGKSLKLKMFLDEKENQSKEAIKLAAGIRIDALSNQETVTPNEDFLASVKVFYPGNSSIKIKEIKLNTPNNWQISNGEEPKNDSPFARFFRETANDSKFFNVTVGSNAKPTQPYFLENPRVGDLYQWSKDANQTEPFQKPILTAIVVAEIGGTEISFDQPVEYRYADDERGEIRRELNIVPEVTVSLDQNLLIIPQSNKAQTRRIVMSITNNSQKLVEAEVGLNVKLFGDWQTTPLTQKVNLKKKGEKTSVAFEITIPADTKPKTYTIFPTATVEGGVYSDEVHTIAYPHIQTHRFYTQLNAKAIVLDLKTAPVKIGYIAGSGDKVADAIRQMNFDVEMLNEKDLTSGDLSKFDTIVVGIRASQVRPDFVSNNQRLLDFVKNGGTMIVQYQPPSYQNLLPFPAQIGARVVDENAKVTILEPMNPVFNFPNKITDEDFAGWVQERNLNSFTTFDENYKPLLETHDVNEPENKGGLLVADIGKGKFVYCSYALFRQLPAGNPGAFRLLANLLSLPKSKN